MVDDWMWNIFAISLALLGTLARLHATYMLDAMSPLRLLPLVTPAALACLYKFLASVTIDVGIPPLPAFIDKVSKTPYRDRSLYGIDVHDWYFRSIRMW
jgi:hypothetical protein